MRSLVRHITRKSRGGFAVREEVAEDDVLAIGRGADCAIYLPDPRILLRHAELSMRGGEVYVTALSHADVRINGFLTTTGKLTTRDVLLVGPFEIKREEVGAAPQSGDDRSDATPPDLILTVEMVQPLEDDLLQLVKRSRIDITRIGFPLRTWSWILGLAAVILLFAVPFGLNLFHQRPDVLALTRFHKQPAAAPTGVWTSGVISSSHKFFGVACETCHEIPFISVRDNACLKCHDSIHQHAMEARYPRAALRSVNCANCHKEHRGEVAITLNDQTFCASCHATLVETTQDKNLRDVSDFGIDHPQFRPTVMVDTATHRTDRSRAIGDTPPPMSNNGLIFSHERHLRVTGIRDPQRGNVQLTCQDCHAPTADGHSMKTPTFEENCHGCHQLKFDALVPDRELMHGNPEDVFKQVQDIYAAVAMRGGYEEPAAPEIVRRRPGTTLTEPQKQVVADWAASKTAEVINGRFGKGLCAECHVISGGDVPAGDDHPPPADHISWQMEPTDMSMRFLPNAEFTHARHKDVACSTCHDAKHSAFASDVLLPSVAVCQSCHGGEKSANRVPSTCVTCHRFHRDDMDMMHPNTAKPAETLRDIDHQSTVHQEAGNTAP